MDQTLAEQNVRSGGGWGAGLVAPLIGERREFRLAAIEPLGKVHQLVGIELQGSRELLALLWS
jgi:hypothetical protein